MVFSTQQSIDIAGVKDGIVIMKDGSYRLILKVNAVNFSLKSEAEQNSLIFQYQGFLNSLHFPIEIVIRSKRLDLTPYLRSIADLANSQTNELIKIQTGDYVDFVGKLINLANIMKKNFYVCISYVPITVKKVGFFDQIFNKGTQNFDHLKISDQEYNTYTEKIQERANIVASGLGGMGLHCAQLSSEEIIELFYEIYNPDVASKERLSDAAVLASPVITSASEASESITSGHEDKKMIDNRALAQESQKRAAEAQSQAAFPSDLGSPAEEPVEDDIMIKNEVKKEAEEKAPVQPASINSAASGAQNGTASPVATPASPPNPYERQQ